jgi:hypothetical protein
LIGKEQGVRKNSNEFEKGEQLDILSIKSQIDEVSKSIERLYDNIRNSSHKTKASRQ